MFRKHRAFALLLTVVCASGVYGAVPNYKVSTRIYSHSNDNGQDLTFADENAAGRAPPETVGDPGTRGFKDPAQILNPKVNSDTPRSAGSDAETLAQSITTVGDDGWTTVKADNTPSSVTLGADIGKGVVGTDKDGASWYFLAPANKFSGDMSLAYNGRLMFTLVHAETPSGGSVRREPDVILEAKCGHSLMLYNVASKVPYTRVAPPRPSFPAPTLTSAYSHLLQCIALRNRRL
jgi:hypothetical protein